MAITRLFSFMSVIASTMLIPAIGHAEDDGPRWVPESRIHSTDHVYNGCYAGTYDHGYCVSPSSPRVCTNTVRHDRYGRARYRQGTCYLQEIRVRRGNPDSVWERWRNR